MSKTLVLINPSACQGRAAKKESLIRKLCSDNLKDFSVIVTRSEEHLRSEVRKSFNVFDSVIGAGGDTTFRIICEEIYTLDADKECKPAVGMAGALGSANDVFRALDFMDAESVFKGASAGNYRYMDACLAQTYGRDYFFTGTLSTGFSSEVNRYIDSFKKARGRIIPGKSLRQFAGGFLGTFKALKGGDSEMNIKAGSEGDVRRISTSLLLILNIPFYANGLKMSEKASPFNGELTLISLIPSSFFKVLKAFGKIKKGKRDSLKEFSCLEVELEFESPGQILIDGDLEERSEEMKVTVLKDCIKIIKPLCS